MWDLVIYYVIVGLLTAVAFCAVIDVVMRKLEGLGYLKMPTPPEYVRDFVLVLMLWPLVWLTWLVAKFLKLSDRRRRVRP